MKLALDAKRAFHNHTGLGNFSRWMIRLYARYFDLSELLLLSPKMDDSFWYDELKESGTQLVDLGRGLKAIQGRAFPVRRLQSFGITHFHGMSNELPLQSLKNEGIKSVVSIHDVIFRRYPAYYKPIDRKIYDLKVKRSISQADAVHCISHSTARDLKQFYELEEEKIHVIPLGKGLIEPLISHDGKKRHSLAKPRLICVSSFESRKNLERLIEAFKSSDWAREGELVLAGKRGDKANTIEENIKTGKFNHAIRCIFNPSASELAALYRSADAFVYPSEFEGFGIPLLEAMHFKLPLAVSSASSMPEVGGDAALYFDPLSVEEITEAINRLGSLVAQPDWEEKISHQLMKFEDERIAGEWKKLYDQI